MSIESQSMLYLIFMFLATLSWSILDGKKNNGKNVFVLAAIFLGTMFVSLELVKLAERFPSLKTQIGTYHQGDTFPLPGDNRVCTITGGYGNNLVLDCPFPELTPQKQ